MCPHAHRCRHFPGGFRPTLELFLARLEMSRRPCLASFRPFLIENEDSVGTRRCRLLCFQVLCSTRVICEILNFAKQSCLFAFQGGRPENRCKALLVSRADSGDQFKERSNTALVWLGFRFDHRSQNARTTQPQPRRNRREKHLEHTEAFVVAIRQTNCPNLLWLHGRTSTVRSPHRRACFIPKGGG